MERLGKIKSRLFRHGEICQRFECFAMRMQHQKMEAAMTRREWLDGSTVLSGY